jgi:hypothetical protein
VVWHLPELGLKTRSTNQFERWSLFGLEALEARLEAELEIQHPGQEPAQAYDPHQQDWELDEGYGIGSAEVKEKPPRVSVWGSFSVNGQEDDIIRCLFGSYRVPLYPGEPVSYMVFLGSELKEEAPEVYEILKASKPRAEFLEAHREELVEAAGWFDDEEPNRPEEPEGERENPYQIKAFDIGPDGKPAIPKHIRLDEDACLAYPLGERLRALVIREAWKRAHKKRFALRVEEAGTSIRPLRATGKNVDTPWGRFSINQLLVAYMTGIAYQEVRAQAAGVPFEMIERGRLMQEPLHGPYQYPETETEESQP